MTPFHLLVLSIAVFRATRLVTSDTISEPWRDRLRQRSHRTFHRQEIDGTVVATRLDERDDRPFSLWAWKLVTCPWCIGLWISAFAIGSYLTWGAAVLDVAYVLSSSAVAGVLMELT